MYDVYLPTFSWFLWFKDTIHGFFGILPPITILSSPNTTWGLSWLRRPWKTDVMRRRRVTVVDGPSLVSPGKIAFFPSQGVNQKVKCFWGKMFQVIIRKEKCKKHVRIFKNASKSYDEMLYEWFARNTACFGFAKKPKNLENWPFPSEVDWGWNQSTCGVFL